jgi:hypothetical protein
MKKIYFALFMLIALPAYSWTQTIEDFEYLKLNLFASGTNGSVTAVPNPDPTGANTSLYVGQMVRGHDGDPWAGWYALVRADVDAVANPYAHIKVWKPRISPVAFKYENGTAANSGDVFPIAAQTLEGQWEELVFNMGEKAAGTYKQIVLIPDFESPTVTLTEDITLYFDDIYVNNDPTVGSAPVQVLEDFETIPLNVMMNNDQDLSTMTVVANPDISGVNISANVIQFLRDKDGVPWGGFWSPLPTPVDVTDNKYVHVKVWKPRISPIFFKIEGGGAGTIELESINPQTTTEAWEDIVFDFSEKTGTYPTIVFMPDYENPLTLTEDITIYFDDIILNNDPNPMTPPVQVFNVDMNGVAGFTDQAVYISGTLDAAHGTWAEPGTIAENQMTDEDEDGIYSITLSLPNGGISFKFFFDAGWGNGDPAGDRQLTVAGSTEKTFKWGISGEVNVPVQTEVTVRMYPNPVGDLLYISTPTETRKLTIHNITGQLVREMNFKTTGNFTIKTGDLISGAYFVTLETGDGARMTQKIMKK